MAKPTAYHANASQQASAGGSSGIGELARLILVILLSPLIYAFTREAFLFVIANFDVNLLRYFIYGIGACCLIYLLIPKPVRFFEVFEHELAHATVATALGREIRDFKVTLEEGEVTYSNGRNFLISLAPYYLPVLALPFLLVKPLAPPSRKNIIDFLIGFSLAFHYVALIGREFRRDQPDIEGMGFWFSVGIVLLMNAIILVIVISGVLGNYSGVLEYLESAWLRTQESYTIARDALENSDLAYVLLSQLP